MKSRIIFISLLALLVFSFLARVYINQNSYTQKFNPTYWQQLYEESQWATNPKCNTRDPHINPRTCAWDNDYYAFVGKYLELNPEDSIGDDGLYTYVGWKYIKGEDPTLINAEIPPLGKYLIGASIVMFNNQNVFALVSAIAALLTLYFLNHFVFKNKIFALIPVVLFSFEPLFYTQMNAPFLDLLYLVFLNLIFIAVIKKRFVLAGLALGCMMATKSPTSTFALALITITAYGFLQFKFKVWKQLVLFGLSSLIVFTLTYARYFQLGHTPVEFLKVQKWIIDFYSQSAKSQIGSVFEMLMLNKWSIWWENKTIAITEWRLTWPLLTISLFAYIFLAISRFFKKKKISKDPITLIVIWSIIYLIFLTFIPVWPRYLLLLIPFLYTIATWLFVQYIPKIDFKRKKKK